MLEFRKLSIITATICSILFLVLLFVPEIIFSLFQIQEHESAFFISRRAAMLFLGIAVFSWFGRNALPSELRQAICIGLSISMFALAILGIYEFSRDFVGMGIGLAVVTELILALAYFRIWIINKNA
ncbi:MAG: hypothetical protein OQL19_02565 [Gammaproteobacteria bacterium]|nr:hypothetical protein [Gammaproteobacteria bacterium]